MIVLVLTWIAFGLLVGLMARAMLVSGRPIRVLPSTLLGILGAFFGSVLGNVLMGVRAFEVHAAGFIGSVIGALIVLVALGAHQRHAAA